MFPISPNPAQFVDREKKFKEVLDFFAKNPSIDGRYYYTAVFNESLKVDDPMPVSEILNLLQQGVEVEADFGCAAKLLFYHIEPCRLNNGMPDYECEDGVKAVLTVFRRQGLYDFCDEGSKRMSLVHMVMNYMDLSSVLREFIRKR